jgi:peptidyl-dipeptidase Dcp
MVLQISALITVGALTLIPGNLRGQSAVAGFGPGNPFYAPSTLPFQAPPFDKIKDADYQPAIEAGIVQKIDEVRAIADNPAEPTFENTLVAMEQSGRLIDRVMNVFNGVTGANMNPVLEKVQETEAPKLAAMQDAIYLNARLFQRVSKIYDQRNSLHLDAESLRLVEYEYQQFVLAGARLSDSDKAELKKINEEEANLSTAFTQKLLAAAKDAAYVTRDKQALAGLSEAQLAAAAQDAKDRKVEGWVLPLQNTTQQPELQSLSNRAAWPSCAHRKQNCWAIRTTRPGSWSIRWPRHRMRRSNSWTRSCPLPPPKRLVKPRIFRRSLMRSMADLLCSRGTGTFIPSRSARRNTIWTRRRSSLTSS